MTNPVNGLAPNDGGLSPSGTAPKKSLGQEDFLRLMIAQVQHQDPMDPQTNGDFMAQLAQFSTSDGINNMQRSIEQLSASLESNQALQASSLVGRKVMVVTDQVQLDAEGETHAAIEMVEGVDNLTASIFSPSGELVKTIRLGQPEPGLHKFSWNGLNEKNERMPEGKYKILVTGRYENQEVALKSMASANVNSVSLGSYGEGIKLNVSGMGTISLADVKEISA